MKPQTGIYEFRQEEDAALLDDTKGRHTLHIY